MHGVFHTLHNKNGHTQFYLFYAGANLVLWSPSVSSLERASHHQHGLDGPQPPIVMVLLREKLFAESVESEELSGQNSSVKETFGHQHDLCDQFKVWHDHGTRSE